MTLPGLLIGVYWAGLTAYAVLGGADFGAGVLHLITPDGRTGRRRRRAITDAMGPVWEANHVWLIFFLTGLLTTFPTAFSALGSATFVPATLALVGIVVRGAALAFASQLGAGGRAGRAVRLTFGIASAVTPLLFGAVAAGLARGRVVSADGVLRAGGGAALWIGPLQTEVGLLAVFACTALAATFMTVEAGRAGRPGLAGAFRALALWATLATAALAVLGLALVRVTTPRLFDGLVGRGLPAVIAGIVALGVALTALRWRRDRLARGGVAAFMAALVWGWGLAQYPALVGPGVTVSGAAAGPAELRAMAIALAAGAALLLPALWLLYGAFRRRPIEVVR